MTPKNRTLEGKNRTLGGEGGGGKNDRTSFMDVPYYKRFPSFDDISTFEHQNKKRHKVNTISHQF